MYTDAKTVNAEAWVRSCFVQQHGQPMIEGPVEVMMDVHVVVPSSWSLKRRAEAVRFPPMGKPDLDNVVKLYFDALNGILFGDDTQVVKLSAQRVWGQSPFVRFWFRHAPSLSS